MRAVDFDQPNNSYNGISDRLGDILICTSTPPSYSPRPVTVFDPSSYSYIVDMPILIMFLFVIFVKAVICFTS